MDLDSLRIETERLILRPTRAEDFAGWAEVIHPIDPDNDGSKRVASRLGSTLRGAGRLPVPLDKLPVEIWGQTREQWRQRRRSA